MVRFAHLADCHIGAWRDPRLSQLVDDAFSQAVSRVIAEEVDFVVLAGDLFNTALPAIDRLKHAVRELERVKQAGIKVYFIAGSHDYSPTGKTMLDVLEEAGLGVNVFREATSSSDSLVLEPVVDAKTGASLVGVPGKAGQLDKELFARLDTHSLQELSSPKIFLFHAALTELTPARLQGGGAQSVSLLPRGFDYYAGGHVHVVEEQSLEGYRRVVYPGPLFPASFSELEAFGSGGFCLVDLANDSFERVSVRTKDVFCVSIDCAGLTPEVVTDRLSKQLSASVEDKVVLVRVSGRLARGTVSDIGFREVFSSCEQRGAYTCLKNTVGVSSPQLLSEEDVSVSGAREVEREVFSQYADSLELPGVSDQEELLHGLLQVLSESQGDGETKKSYEQRVVSDAFGVLGLDEKEK